MDAVRRFTVTLVVVALLAALAACTPTEGPGAARPSILLITVDGLTADALADAGPMARTRALVDDGALWSDAVTVTPLTRPAVATYLTGLTPPSHGVRDDSSTALAPGAQTLAGALRAAGYATGAFPDSSALGFDSGLLEGFEIVDDPPAVPIGALTWLPTFASLKPTAANMKAWLGRTPAERPVFAWAHFSHGLIRQLLPEDVGERPTLEELDARIGSLVDTFASAGRGSSSWIVVAATAADVVGAAGHVAGPGLSLAPAAVRVPVVIRPPAGSALDGGGSLWGPDVATTLARIAGAELPNAAGVDLRDGLPAGRIRLAWSAAPRDQLGWRPLLAAGRGGAWLVRGDAASDVRHGTDGEDDATWSDLARALDGAAMPPAPQVPYDTLGPVFDTYGVSPDPVAAGGRRFDDPAARVAVGRTGLDGRVRLMLRDVESGRAAMRSVLEIDPENLGARVALSQLPALRGESELALRAIRPAVASYPDHPDVLHWFAHAIWSRSVPDAAAVLTAVEPYKPREGDVLYDLACARSLAGELAESEAFLTRAIESGYRFWQAMDGDPDLRNLRESGRFAAVMREYRR